MNFTIETITPEKASEYLKKNICNRAMSPTYIKRYAKDMKQGNWTSNGVPIIFDADGILVDGQQRLHAIIEAGIPVEMVVCRGVGIDAFMTIDCGRHRNLGQLISRKRGKHYNLVAAAALANHTLITHGRLAANNGVAAQGKDTNAEMYKFYEADPEGYQAVADWCVPLTSKCRLLAPSWVAGTAYYLMNKGGYDENYVKTFFENLLLPFDQTSIYPAINMLRRMLIDFKVSNRKATPEYTWALLVKTWNYYVGGTCPKVLKYAVTEDMPTLKLNV